MTRTLLDSTLDVLSAAPRTAESESGLRQALAEAVRRRAADDVSSPVVFWVPKVRPEARVDHESAAREAGFPDYQVHPPTSETPWVARKDLLGDLAFPVLHIEPRGEYEGLRGLDLARLPEFREAMTTALGSGQSAASPIIRWPDPYTDPMMMILFRPVGPDRKVELTSAQRLEQLDGFVAILVRVEGLIAKAFRPFSQEIDVLLYNTSDSERPELMGAYDFRSGEVTRGGPEVLARRATMATELVELDMPWGGSGICGVPTQAYWNSRRSALPVAVLAFGLLLTAVVGAYANTLLGARRRSSSW